MSINKRRERCFGRRSVRLARWPPRPKSRIINARTHSRAFRFADDDRIDDYDGRTNVYVPVAENRIIVY